jgi:selenocysteine-specific elongation factor
MIIGTAGHIDHGKTALVRALTGIETDRLKEEKERGISIELGYAYTPLPNGDVLGFIDVPGHERLIHTMVAGAAGIDFALLVVAADDGVMPQTREHVAILELLGIKRGAVALSKADRVDAARIAAVRADLDAALASSRLLGAPVFELNATDATDAGVVALREHLGEAAAQHAARRDDGLFRLAIDRVFTLAGHGTVVTGTAFAGQVRPGDHFVLMPSGAPVRVRSVHAQNRASELGRAGQRCALNLAGIEKDAIARGDWLCDPRALRASTRLDVRLDCLRGAAPVAGWTPLHLHFATTHRIAHVVPLEGDSIAPGTAGYAQLVFVQPVCATAGDRFIVRNPQAARTLGGGVVLDPLAPGRKRRSAARLAYLGAIERMLEGAGIAGLLELAPFGLADHELMYLTGQALERIVVPDAAVAIALNGAEQRVLMPRVRWQALRAQALEALHEFHRAQPDEAGVTQERWRRIAAPALPAPLWRVLVDELLHEGEIARESAWLRLPGHAVTLSAAEQPLAEKLRHELGAAGFDPPWPRELARRLAAPEERVRTVLRKLVRLGEAHQVVPDLFYPGERVRALAEIAATVARRDGRIEAAHYRDAIGLGRKRAIQILEFFDRVGYTRRVRDAHVLRGDGAAFGPHQAPGE